MKTPPLALALLALLAGHAHANLLVNPSFEAVDASASPYYIRSSASTPGWTQTGDGVDLIHDNYTQTPGVLVNPSDGAQFLDMNQALWMGLGGVRQVVVVAPGQRYELALDAVAWAGNGIGGTLGYQLYDPVSNDVLDSGSFHDAVGGTWSRRTLEATALSPTLGVYIYGLYASGAGMGLDNVSLAAAVPEPQTWALMFGGLLPLAALARRRRRAA